MYEKTGTCHSAEGTGDGQGTDVRAAGLGQRARIENKGGLVQNGQTRRHVFKTYRLSIQQVQEKNRPSVHFFWSFKKLGEDQGQLSAT